MSLEKDLKEAFERHHDDVQPDQKVWEGIERGVRRAHRARVVMTSGITAALVVGMAVLIPRLTSDKTDNHGFINGTSTPSATGSPSGEPSTVSPGDLGGNYRDDVQGWVIYYDETWKESRFEGVTEFNPPGLPASIKGEPTFWVAIQIIDGRPASTNPPATASTPFDARFAGTTTSSLTNGGVRQISRYDWTGLCISTIECPAGPATLQVLVEGSSAQLWAKYHPTSDAMLQTLQIANDSSGNGNTRTRYGVVDFSGAAYDDLTSTLVRFLDARVEQGNAEAFMTSTAKDNFAHSTVCSALYSNKMTHDPWRSYEVMYGTVENGQTKYTVIMTSGPGSTGCGESVVVGTPSGATSPMILSDVFQSLGDN